MSRREILYMNPIFLFLDPSVQMSTNEILFPFKFNFWATEFNTKVVWLQLSKRLVSTMLEFDSLTLMMGFKVAPILAPFTNVEFAKAVAVLALVWFQLILETHSGVLIQM